jgi:DNA-binding transcriptional ArsR family regulator
MISFIEGKINLGEKNILAVSDKDLSVLAEQGLIEKREDGVGTYYYVEAEADGMRFGAFISLREKRIDWVRLSWLDSPVKGWDDVSEKAMKDEYRLLSNFVEKEVGGPPENKGNRKRTWRFKWGQVDVTYEPRAYQANIFMKPR